jgi:tellurite resistance protein TerC
MILFWIGFIAVVLLLLALDLGVLNRRPHVIHALEALAWTAFWVVLALIFNIGIYYVYEHHWLGIGQVVGHELTGRQAAVQFLTGYLVEKSLILVIALIFTYFRVPLPYQHRVLFWGILGALALRGLMIVAGAALIQRFFWMTYVLGALLLVAAVRMMMFRHAKIDPQANPLFRLARRLFPVTGDYEGTRFFSRLDGRRAITPLFLVLLVVESSDVLFAVDSIPAVFAVTRDPFLVFTSNVFAILGLRSLYFALASLVDRFRYLKIGLVFILAYVGVKMLLSHHYLIPTSVSLAVIALTLSASIAVSIWGARRGMASLVPPMPPEIVAVAEITYRAARRIVILVVGATVLLTGVAMLALPGPGSLFILTGLGILAIEFAFARRLLRRAKEAALAFKGRVSSASQAEKRDGD